MIPRIPHSGHSTAWVEDSSLLGALVYWGAVLPVLLVGESVVLHISLKPYL